MGDIPIRSFERDLINSNKRVLKQEWNKVMNKVFGEGCKVEWREDMVSQLGFGVDILLVTKKGRKYSIEVKTRRNDYFDIDTWILEVSHHRYKDKDMNLKISTVPGWLYRSTSDILFYGTLDEDGTKIIEVCGFTLSPFKDEEFKNKISGLESRSSCTRFKGGVYQRTIMKMADIKFLKDNAHKFWYLKNEL